MSTSRNRVTDCRTEDIRGNRPRVAGTGVSVRRIVGWYKQGLTP